MYRVLAFLLFSLFFPFLLFGQEKNPSKPLFQTLKSTVFIADFDRKAEKPSGVVSLEFSSNSKYLLTGLADGRIKIWKIIKNNAVLIEKIFTHGSSLTSAVFSKDGKYLASASPENGIKVWDWNNRSLLTSVKDYAYDQVIFSPDNKWLIASTLAAKPGTGSSLFFWSFPQMKLLKVIPLPVKKIADLLFFPEADTLFFHAPQETKISFSYNLSQKKLSRLTLADSMDQKFFLSSKRQQLLLIQNFRNYSELLSFNRKFQLLFRKSSRDYPSLIEGALLAEKSQKLFLLSLDKKTNNVNLYADNILTKKHLASFSSIPVKFQKMTLSSGEKFLSLSGLSQDIHSHSWVFLIPVNKFFD